MGLKGGWGISGWRNGGVWVDWDCSAFCGGLDYRELILEGLIFLKEFLFLRKLMNFLNKRIVKWIESVEIYLQMLR